MPAGAAHDDDADIFIAVEPVDDGGNLVGHLIVDGVALVGPVERHIEAPADLFQQ